MRKKEGINQGTESAVDKIGELENQFHHHPIKEDIAMLKVEFEFSEGGIIPVYVACPKEVFNRTVDYTKKTLGIDNSRVFEICINPQRADIQLELEKLLKENLSAARGIGILVVARGFERLVSSHMGSSGEANLIDSYRWGHDYDQDIVESSILSGEVSRRKLNIVVLTHIDTSANEEVVKGALSTAAGSQFKRGMIVV